MRLLRKKTVQQAEKAEAVKRLENAVGLLEDKLQTDLDAARPSTYSHYSGRSGVCDVCNGPAVSGEAFQVPTRFFWSSTKYKEWVATNPMTKSMLAMHGLSVDNFITTQRNQDMSKYSVVCPNCVHLFTTTTD